jgi:ABC-2 type transport system permease protein
MSMFATLARIGAVASKEFRHIGRDHVSGGMILGIPIMMSLLFGYAINNDVRHLNAGVVDDAGTSGSRALLADAQATQVINIVRRADSPHELERMLARGDISVGIYVPPDFEQRRVHGDRPLAQLLVDGSDPTVLNAARALQKLGAPAATAPQLELRALYNPERRSPVFIVPGLCGVILTLTMVLFTAVAIVRERERGNLELLITTPIKPLELMVGKILPYILIGYVQISLILIIGVALFDVPVRGELEQLYIGAGVFVISTLTLGLLISTLAQNQFQAFQMTFMSFLPQLLLSGFMFPFEGMPRPAQMLAEIFPLTHFLRIVRGIILRDADLMMMWPDIWPLLVFFVVMMTLATVRFRKSLD